MIVQRAPDEITSWSVAFFREGRYRLARFVPGEFKHCLAFGYSEPCRTWVVYDVTLAGTRLYVLPDGPWGVEALADLLKGAAIVRLAVSASAAAPRWWLGFWCVPAIRHLVRCRCGALTPTALYRGLIAEGGEVLQDGRRPGTIRSPCAA